MSNNTIIAIALAIDSVIWIFWSYCMIDDFKKASRYDKYIHAPRVLRATLFGWAWPLFIVYGLLYLLCDGINDIRKRLATVPGTVKDAYAITYPPKPPSDGALSKVEDVTGRLDKSS